MLITGQRVLYHDRRGETRHAHGDSPPRDVRPTSNVAKVPQRGAVRVRVWRTGS